MKPTFKAPGTKRSNLKYAELLSNFAFNVNLRRYNKAGRAVTAAVASRLRAELLQAGAYTRPLFSST
jgi:hypothetical protein